MMLGCNSECAFMGEACIIRDSRRYNSEDTLEYNKRIGYCRVCGDKCKYWSKIKKAENVLETAFKIFNKSILIDASKKVKWIKDNEMPSKIIHLTRNGLDVMGSFKKRDDYDSQKVMAWVRKNKKIMDFIKDKDSLQVKYEDICEADGLQKCCEFIGIEYDEKMREYWKIQHHCIGGNTNIAKKPKIISNKWRLNKGDLRVFEQHGGERLNRRLGYE